MKYCRKVIYKHKKVCAWGTVRIDVIDVGKADFESG